MRPDPGPELAQLQRALFARITGPVSARSQGSDGVDDPEAWLAAPAQLAREQVGVYRDLYALRLRRELARAFPATRALLGDARFASAARAFAARARSRSFTLDGYARGFGSFLRRSGGVSERRLWDSAAALARLEYAHSQVRRAAPSRRRGVRAGGMDRSEGALLLVFAWDVMDAHARFARRRSLRALRERHTCVALFRRGRSVAMLRVTAREAPLLRSLLSGKPWIAAVEAASESGLRPCEIRRAFERWVGTGLLEAPRPGA